FQSAGIISTNGPGGFDVTGTHTYAVPQSYQITVTITDVGGSTATPLTTAKVVQELAATGKDIDETEGEFFTDEVVATFTDADPASRPADLAVYIDWGDGFSTPGTIVANGNGNYDVTGDHVYSEEGSYPLHILIVDAKGPFAQADGHADVDDALLAGT